ncbi:hypothetical protein D3C80_1277290 [compost metagenome]
MAGHGRDEQNFGIRLIGWREVALEMQQLTEGFRPDDLFFHRNRFAIHGGFVQAEIRLGIASRGPLENFEACR